MSKAELAATVAWAANDVPLGVCSIAFCAFATDHMGDRTIASAINYQTNICKEKPHFSDELMLNFNNLNTRRNLDKYPSLSEGK